MDECTHEETLANIREQLLAAGFTFHTASDLNSLAEHARLTGKWWYCWMGPLNKWDVESGPTCDTIELAVASAAMALADYQREKLEEIAAAMRDTAPKSCADAVECVCFALDELNIDYAPQEEPEEGCAHEWVHTGTAYGGDDERYHGEGRAYCSKCGQDGDA